MNLAERFSNHFKNDGQCWSVSDGIDHTLDFWDYLAENDVQSAPVDGENQRHIFPDGSVIVTWPSAWDIGYQDADCFCGTFEGHSDLCEHSPYFEPEA